MIENYHILETTITSTISLIIGVYLSRVFENKPKLVHNILSHGTGKLKHINGETSLINTHSLVIRNVGRNPAINVRIGHKKLPGKFNLDDIINIGTTSYIIDTLSNDYEEIVIPRIIPKQEIVITYVYCPPLTYLFVTHGAYVKSDECYSEQVKFDLTKQNQRWIKNMVTTFFVIGIISTFILAYLLLNYILISSQA